MKWTKLIVEVNPMAVEALTHAVLEMGIEGIEVDDQFLSESDKEAMLAGYVDDSIQPLAEHKVIAYLDETQDVIALKANVETELERLRAFLEVGSGNISVEEMPNEDYAHKWKEFYEPFKVGSNILVTPIWIEPEVEANDILIKIDPGLAFGSGTHETTSLVIELMEKINLKDKSIIDVGCGSGILGIAAAKLGATSIIGVDIDENAVTIAKENVISNQVDHVMDIREGNLLDQIDEKADIIVANILADVILLIASDVKKALKDDGIFIASGILSTRGQEVMDLLMELGFNNLTTLEQGEWVAIQAMV